MRQSVDIIVPIYNEEASIEAFYQRLTNVLDSTPGVQYRILFSNNASSDRSAEIVLRLRETDPRIELLTLSRNFGYQGSLMASLSHCTADATIVIDVDGEDPPELIPEFIKFWRQGYHLVYGERNLRPEAAWLVYVRKAFYRLTRMIADSDFILDMAEFSLFSKEIRSVILDNKTTYPFVRSEMAYAGFKRYAISYSRQPRIAGKSNYNFPRMVSFAIAGILTSSTYPLRLTAYSGVGVFFANIAMFAYLLFARENTPAWTVQALNQFNWIFAIMGISSTAIYLARVYKNGVHRPLYVVNYDESTLDSISGGIANESGHSGRGHGHAHKRRSGGSA